MVAERVGFELRPMAIGAEITGIDYSADLPEPTRRALYDAWLEYGVLLFRGVDSIARHLNVSRWFGEPELHPVEKLRFPEEPLLMPLGYGENGPIYVFEDGPRLSRLPWHRDTAFTPDICRGAALRIVETPPVGGETMFCDSSLAYDALSPELKARIENLEVRCKYRFDLAKAAQPGRGGHWASARPATAADGVEVPTKPITAEIEARFPAVVHPLVITHPESGRKCLFISPTYVECVLGMAQEESDALMTELVTHLLSAQFVYIHRWKNNDVVLWDNFRCLHAARGYRPSDTRKGLRTTLKGALTTGRYFDPGVSAPLPLDFAD